MKITSKLKREVIILDDFEENRSKLIFPEPSAKNIELFDKSAAETIGWIDLPKGGFKKMLPRLRVEIYHLPSSVYGPIMISYNAICPENMRLSQTLAQAHLPAPKAIELISLLAVAVKKVMPALTFQDVWRQAEEMARRILEK